MKRRTKIVLSLAALGVAIVVIVLATREERIAYAQVATEDLGESGQYVLAELSSFGRAYPNDSADGKFRARLTLSGFRVLNVEGEMHRLRPKAEQINMAYRGCRSPISATELSS